MYTDWFPPAAAAVFALALPASPSAADPKLPCAYEDKPCALKALRAHPAKKIAFWKSELAKPVAQRLGPAPPELVEILALDNIYNAYPNRPRRATPAQDFVAEVRQAVAELPEAVKRPLEDKLAGIYFVEDIGGTAFTDVIYADSKPAAGFVIIDPSVLQRSANDWATWKENTPFEPHPDFKLVATIEEARRNTRQYAIQYILLHEFGHVLSIGGNVHPSWNVPLKDIATTAEFPFFELSWSISKAENRFVTRFDAVFPQRRNVVYYFGAKLRGEEMVRTYEALERTSFATLYSATHPGDDFAEAFASYVHTVLMRQPFAIELYRNGRLAKTFKSCWAEKRCAQKRRIIEAMLENRSP